MGDGACFGHIPDLLQFEPIHCPKSGPLKDGSVNRRVNFKSQGNSLEKSKHTFGLRQVSLSYQWNIFRSMHYVATDELNNYMGAVALCETGGTVLLMVLLRAPG